MKLKFLNQMVVVGLLVSISSSFASDCELNSQKGMEFFYVVLDKLGADYAFAIQEVIRDVAANCRAKEIKNSAQYDSCPNVTRTHESDYRHEQDYYRHERDYYNRDGRDNLLECGECIDGGGSWENGKCKMSRRECEHHHGIWYRDECLDPRF